MRFAEQWSWCTVETVRDVTTTIREFRLRPENGRVPPYPAGSHIGVTVLIDGQPDHREATNPARDGPAREGTLPVDLFEQSCCVTAEAGVRCQRRARSFAFTARICVCPLAGLAVASGERGCTLSPGALSARRAEAPSVDERTHGIGDLMRTVHRVVGSSVGVGGHGCSRARRAGVSSRLPRNARRV